MEIAEDSPMAEENAHLQGPPTVTGVIRVACSPVGGIVRAAQRLHLDGVSGLPGGVAVVVDAQLHVG